MCSKARFKKTTWGGWTPEEPEFSLSFKEKEWKMEIQNKYNVQFMNIGLDESYMQDSILYMNIWVQDDSPLQQQLIKSTKPVLEISKSYMKIISSERTQTFIELTLDNLHAKENGDPGTRLFLYNIKKNSIIEE